MPKLWVLTAAAISLGLGFMSAAEPDPKVLSYTPPDKIKWTGRAGSAQQAVLVGDPSKPGLYIILVKWPPHSMSRPHFHETDRFVTVLSGTWWVGTGSKYDPDSTYPMKAGSFVTDIAKQIHYDGAKDEECVLEIVGTGPVSSVAAETK